MGLEVGTDVDDLNASWPLGGDARSTTDDHLRLIKAVLKAMYPGSVETIFSLSTAMIARAALGQRLSDDGAGVGPSLILDRLSASPAASDILSEIIFSGRDSATNAEKYARIFASIVDPTSTSEDGLLNLATVVAGTLATRLSLGAGLYSASATGGDQGVGTINLADGLFVNGVRQEAILDVQAVAASFYSFDGFPSWVNDISLSYDIVPASDVVTSTITLRKAGPTDIATNEYYAAITSADGTTLSNAAATASNGMGVVSSVQNDANVGGLAVVCEIFNIRSSRYKRAIVRSTSFDGLVSTTISEGWSIRDTAIFTGIRVNFSGGLGTGRFRLKGLP